MGNKVQSRKRQQKTKTTEMGQNVSEVESTWEQFVQFHSCCGIRYEKISKKRVLWQNLFFQNCQEVKQQFVWAKHLIDLVNRSQLDRNHYYKEMQNLKLLKNVESPSETDVLQSQAEVDSFKQNLKKSVILSFVQATRFTPEPSNTKMVSMIDPVSRKSRIQIERFSRVKIPVQSTNGIRIQKSASISSHREDLRKSIMSFVDDTISSVMGNEREISKQTARDLQIFIKFTMILEKHLNDDGCMLARIKKQFLGFVIKNFGDVKESSEQIGDYVDSIKQFLMILREAVIDYYVLRSFAEEQEGSNLFIANQQNVLSACTAILFRDQSFYQQLFGVVSYYLKERQQKFSYILEGLVGSGPERFHVKDKFCLNQRTIRNYITQLSLSSGESNVENIEIGDTLINSLEPFHQCLATLQQLSKSSSPINKMKAIMACSEGIGAEIQKFYELNGLRKEKWMLDADQVLSIFCYIIANGKVQHLHSHLFILDQFATGHQLISMTGYYLSVMNCAVEQIQKQFGRQMRQEGL